MTVAYMFADMQLLYIEALIYVSPMMTYIHAHHHYSTK
jgi:hypothetical protein